LAILDGGGRGGLLLLEKGGRAGGDGGGGRTGMAGGVQGIMVGLGKELGVPSGVDCDAAGDFFRKSFQRGMIIRRRGV